MARSTASRRSSCMPPPGPALPLGTRASGVPMLLAGGGRHGRGEDRLGRPYFAEHPGAPVSEVDAELARSTLACPASAEVAVDGYPSVGCDDDLGLRDDD